MGINFYNSVNINVDIDKIDVLLDIEDNYLINMLNSRGYKVYLNDDEVKLKVSDMADLQMHRDMDFDININAWDVLDEMSEDDLIEYCKDKHITLDEIGEIADYNFEDVAFELSKLSEYELSLIARYIKQFKRLTTKEDLRKFFNGIIDNWM